MLEILAAMVEAGELPPVEDRLPPEPMVLEVLDKMINKIKIDLFLFQIMP